MATITQLGRVGLVLKGEYSAATQYDHLDVVTHEGSAYVATQSTKGNAPPNATYWQALADASGAAAAATSANAAASTANTAAAAATEAAQTIDDKINARLGRLSFAVAEDGGLDIVYTY